MASTYIQRVDSTDGNRKVWTWSAWVKRDVLGAVEHNMFSMGEAVAEEAQFKFSSDQLSFFNDYATTGRVSSSDPSRKFRDTNGWYHFVWRHKSDETTASDRWKIYINGERLDPSDYGNPSIPNEDGCYNRFSNRDMWFGARAKAQNDGSYQYFSGLMSHIHFCDGYAYDATDFGEYDANGVWKIKTSPSVNYGTHGFFILKDGNSVTDQSGNGNDCTVAGGTLTKTEDSPSNVFATLNPLDNYYCAGTFSDGNNTIVTGSSQTAYVRGTLGVSQGKWYYEAKAVATSSANTWYSIGWSGNSPNGTTAPLGDQSDAVSYQGQNGTIRINTGETSTGTAYTTGDIIGTALDLDNNLVYFYKNGTLVNSGGTSITASASTTNGVWCAAVGDIDTTGTKTWSTNFGNGYFGTTAVSSAGTNASGNGIFEFDVPTGYTALSTKGLNL